MCTYVCVCSCTCTYILTYIICINGRCIGTPTYMYILEFRVGMFTEGEVVSVHMRCIHLYIHVYTYMQTKGAFVCTHTYM